MVPVRSGTGRQEFKASALNRQAKAEALDSKCVALAGTMIKVASCLPRGGSAVLITELNPALSLLACS
jgi:hypothetical protein